LELIKFKLFLDTEQEEEELELVEQMEELVKRT